MTLTVWRQRTAGHRPLATVAALLTTFAGVALLIDRPKGSILEWLAIPFLAIGGALFAWAVWPHAATPTSVPSSLCSKFLRRITWGGRLVKLFPVFGVGIVLTDLTYNTLWSASPSLQTEDFIVLSGAATLIGYGFVPERFSRERDFILLFFIALNGILVVPLLMARVYLADFERSVDLYSWFALAPETGAVLSVLGVANDVHPVAGSTAPGLTFTPQHLGLQVTVVITTACSGIYSFGIFASAFVAFVLTENDSVSRRIWVLLGLGLAGAYVSNVLRMVVIVLVGYYTDTAQTDLQNMLVAHSYAGWLIFLAWIALFWGILIRVMPGELPNAAKPEAIPGTRREATCRVCSKSLTPAVPASRCACGAYYHTTCLELRRTCPSCGDAFMGMPNPVSERA